MMVAPSGSSIFADEDIALDTAFNTLSSMPSTAGESEDESESVVPLLPSKEATVVIPQAVKAVTKRKQYTVDDDARLMQFVIDNCRYMSY